MIDAQRAKAIADEKNSMAYEIVKRKTEKYIKDTVMRAIASAASKGEYRVMVSPSCYADKNILWGMLNEIGYQVRIGRNSILIEWDEG